MSHGVTLTVAKTVIYYTNSHSLEKRLQSEDRPHRIGQTVSVLVIDIAAERTVDVKMIEGLRSKFDVAASVTGDRMREWLTLGDAPTQELFGEENADGDASGEREADSTVEEIPEEDGDSGVE